ncbi:membrane protein [Microbispora rosea subsp. aerata]|nr:membrane protein [Microbispora rosea subsp. aerata]GIH53468.1 membrane protein [Microbispora rosea subsp. aerata]GLJ83150.1 membrane protein [Microbispora rosea subsp. aerata]
MVAQIIQRANPKGMPIVYASALGTLVLFVVIGVIFSWTWIVFGVFAAVLVGMIVFSRFAQKAQYALLHGQPGATYAILQSLRGRWYVEEKPVAVNRDQDLVFRVVGYPGVILVSEGPPNRVQRMLVAEKKRVQRVAIDVPVYDIQCGDAEGQVPLAKLQRHLMKLPRNLKKGAVSEVNNRMRALTPAIPMPKGPIPKGLRMPRGPKMR